MKHTILYISSHTPEQEVRNRLKEALATDNAERFCILQENDCPIRNEWQRQIFFHEHRQEEYICTETGRMVLTRKCMEYILNHPLPLDGKKLVAQLKETPFAPFVKEGSLCIHQEEDIHWWKIATSRDALFANLSDKESSQGLKERIERYWMQSVPLTIDSSGCWYSPTLVGHWFDEGLAKGVSSLFHYMDVREVGDFGCGPGWYVAYWRKQGYDADGYDGNPYTEELSATFFDDGYYCQCADLTEELEADGKFDAIVSLEVGEHIPQDRESTFIRNLTRNARNHIILSWAVEGQAGDGHINCHSNKFIISRMRQYGFVLNRPATCYLRECACLSWFKQTLLCFDRMELIPSPRQPEVSVIVPGYNAASYLEECLDSIRRQSLYPIEVIMVNDGSTDGTKQIMERYCKNDIRFRYFEQENQGLSEARNTGLRYADGQYIMFVDADDCLPEDALMNLCEKARRTDAEMVAGNVVLYYDGKTKDYTTKHPDSEENCTGEDFLCQVVRHGSFTTMVYGYLYRRSFIEQHGLRFEPGILHEDELWTPVALTRAKRVASIGSTTYLYRQHEASIMSSSKAEKRIASMEVVIRRLEEFMESDGMGDNAKEAINHRIGILKQITNHLRTNSNDR